MKRAGFVTQRETFRAKDRIILKTDNRKSESLMNYSTSYFTPFALALLLFVLIAPFNSGWGQIVDVAKQYLFRYLKQI